MTLKMGLRLNNFIFIFFTCFFFLSKLNAQTEDENAGTVYNDYKDKDQFKKFYKRRKIIGAWQINELKTGALVVRLKTNRRSIQAFLNLRDSIKAKEKLMETFIMNKNTMKAYLNNLNFCKLYFMYSNASDSLLNGTRQGIFLDTNLCIDPNISMTENFYLLAERDYIYNSSIGFLPEDSAKLAKESGNPVREMGVTVKNKYGHQLKSPFPYYVKSNVLNMVTATYLIKPSTQIKSTFEYSIMLNNVNDPKRKNRNTSFTDAFKIDIQQEFTYPKLALVISQFNDELKSYYQSSPKPELNKVDAETRKLFY